MFKVQALDFLFRVVCIQALDFLFRVVCIHALATNLRLGSKSLAVKHAPSQCNAMGLFYDLVTFWRVGY